VPPGSRYLKPFRALPALLARLKDLGCPSLIYLERPDARLEAQLACPTLSFQHSPLDIQEVARQCDLAILNGGHGATAAMLLAGKPVLEIPLALEQFLTANAVIRLEAGLSAPDTSPDEILARLDSLLELDYFAAAARRFASRYAAFKPQDQILRIADRIEELARHPAPSDNRPRDSARWASKTVPFDPRP
jgi:UDP:flavonoid glycosyltransferase YjiC (YdhE family)